MLGIWRFCIASRSLLYISMQTKQDPGEPVLLAASKIMLHAKLCLSIIKFFSCVCWHPERICRANEQDGRHASMDAAVKQLRSRLALHTQRGEPGLGQRNWRQYLSRLQSLYSIWQWCGYIKCVWEGAPVYCFRRILLSTRRSTLVLGGEYIRTLVSTLLAQLALC